ncbi:MAG: hypothetical protein WC784_01855 [Candidatus Shapirobacteria bacterium]
MFRNLLFQIFNYIGFHNFYKKHVTVAFVNGKFQITSTSHEDFIAITQKKIDKFSQSKNQKEFISLALGEAIDGCNFIIFSPLGEDDKFVQFWTGEHSLKYNFCFLKTNGLEKYFYSVLGLLSEYGFINKKFISSGGKSFYEIEKGKTITNIYANFGVDIESTTKFIETIYKEIYKIKGKKLVAKVE